MQKIMIMLVALFMGSFSSFGQVTPTTNDDVYLDKSFEDAGTAPADNIEYHLAPKFYKAGELVAAQPIALSAAKEEAVALAKARPTQLRKDCLNVIYTVDPIYSQGTITGAMKGTIVIKWAPKSRKWAFSYLKYQLVNIEQSTQVFMPQIE